MTKKQKKSDVRVSYAGASLCMVFYNGWETNQTAVCKGHLILSVFVWEEKRLERYGIDEQMKIMELMNR